VESVHIQDENETAYSSYDGITLCNLDMGKHPDHFYGTVQLYLW